MVNTLSSVEVLRNKEISQKYYQCRDYLSTSSGSAVVVTAGTRVEMLEWVQKVSLYMKTSDDLAILTATLLDKFLQTPRGQQVLTCLPDFRLATMSCLYLTAKVNDPNVSISSEVMSAFSQGMFSASQVEEYELEILTAMNFYVHPPNALAFVREFLLLLPCSVSKSIKEQAYDHCQNQIQRCMLDYDVFATTEASTIAFFAVQNALRCLGMDPIICGHIASIFSYATHTDFYDTDENRTIIIHSSLMGGEGGSLQQQRKRRRHRRGSASNNNNNKRGRNSITSPRRQQQQRRSSMSSSSTSTTTSSSSSSFYVRRHSWTRRSSSSLQHSSFNESPCGVVH